MKSLCIITSTFNSAAYLEECIQSIELLRSKVDHVLNVFHVFADAGSDDQTLDIITKYRSNFTILASTSDDGIYDAWNKSLQYIFTHIDDPFMFLFLGSDDFLLADASDFVLSTYRLFSQGFNLTSGVAYYEECL